MEMVKRKLFDLIIRAGLKYQLAAGGSQHFDQTCRRLFTEEIMKNNVS